MSSCENNFQILMCFGVNFVSDFIHTVKDNFLIKALGSLLGKIESVGIVVIAIIIIFFMVLWVFETMLKSLVEKLPYPFNLVVDVTLDVLSFNPIGLLDDSKKAVPWWDQGSCAKWSSGEFSTDYTLWEGEGQKNIKVRSYKKPAPFHNVGPDYKGISEKKDIDIDNYGGHVDKLCNDGGDCKMAPGANFGIFSGIGNGNAPRKFAQCCEMNYHFMTEGKGTRMPIWPSECADKNWAGEVGDYVGEAACGLKFWDWGKKSPSCASKRVNSEYSQRASCAYGKLKSIGCHNYFAYSPSPGYKLIPPTGLQNLLTSAGGGEQNWQGGSNGTATTHPYPLGSGIDFYQAYNSYNKFINGSLVNIPVIPEQNKKEIICTGDNPPPKCFGRFRPMTLQERATNQFNFMIDNIKNSPYFDIIFYPLIVLLIIYIINAVVIEYTASCKDMKDVKFNDILGNCKNKPKFSENVNKAMNIRRDISSSISKKIVPNKVQSTTNSVTDNIYSRSLSSP